MTNRIHTAPPADGDPVLGKTLTELLYEAERQYPNPRALNQPQPDGTWKAYALDDFRRQSEDLALGLRALGLGRGERVAFLLKSDVHFCLADMGCLIAGLVDVPIYVTHTPEQVRYVIEHAEAKTLVVSDPEQLERVQEVLGGAGVQTVIVAERAEEAETLSLPEGMDLRSLDAVRENGHVRREEQPDALEALLDEIAPDDLATLIYTSGTTGRPKGVMLTHENISSNAMTSIRNFAGFEYGAQGERILSFLPLTHIFARMLHYGFMAHGVSVYFTTPDELSEDLKKITPTVFATVPRLLEKVYGKIQERTAEAAGLQKRIGTWALRLAGQYRLTEAPSAGYKAQAALADALVFKKWRAALGGQVKYLVAGGAALNPELTNLFAAAGVPIVQGYGLTETSPVIAFNRPERNRPGTVGEPIPGVEVKIADDGEILTRGPHVMRGYYKDQEKTDEVLTADGWLHTGDIGEMSADGFLTITDRKKDLFKLSTGKYVVPSPPENRLGAESLVEQAVVVGLGHPFCAALIFPNEEAVRSFARSHHLSAEQPLEHLISEEPVIEQYQRLVDRANEGMEPWSTIKRFALVAGAPTVDNGLLTPTMKIRRTKVHERYAEQIEQIYRQAEHEEREQGKSVIVS